MIYFDNAATTLKKPESVIEAVTEALKSMGNYGRGAHEGALDAARVIFQARKNLAELFNAKEVTQIAFTANSTESLNIAIKGLLKNGDHVITTELEHNSVLRPLYEMEKEGVQVTFIKADKKGLINYSDFYKNIKKETKAIICTHGSNLTGNLVDIEKIGGIAKDNNLLFIVDASQTAGVIPIDVEKMKIDVLCFTGHKSLLGPQGTGGIYVRDGVKINPLKSGGSGIETYSKTHPAKMPTLLEAGTLNGHGIAGLNAAVDYIKKEGIETLREKELELMKYFYEKVKNISGIIVYGDFSSEIRCPIVTINIRDYESSKVSDVLYDQFGICTRAGGHCAPLMHKALGTEVQGAVRFSFSHYNTKEELDYAIKALELMAAEE